MQVVDQRRVVESEAGVGATLHLGSRYNRHHCMCWREERENYQVTNYKTAGRENK